MTWQDDALCAQVDHEIFFPPKGGSAREARKVCRACPVQAECLEMALTIGADGIWAGTNAKQRRALGGRSSLDPTIHFRPCGTEAARKRHRRAGESCAVCGVAA